MTDVTVLFATEIRASWEELLRKLHGSIIHDNRWKMYLEGLSRTLQIAVIACIIGVAIGLLVAMVKTSAPKSSVRFSTKSARRAYRRSVRAALRENIAQAKSEGDFGAAMRIRIRAFGEHLMRVLLFLCNAYTTIVRGTPLVVQLLILYRMAIMPNGLVACIIGFGLNSGAYVAEIFRSGIQSVDGGQFEAARSLGLSRWQAMRSVILPQAVKNVLPAIFNEFIALVKETSIAGYIAVNDLTKMADAIRGRTFNSVSLFTAALLYLVMTFILTMIHKRLERRFAKSDRN